MTKLGLSAPTRSAFASPQSDACPGPPIFTISTGLARQSESAAASGSCQPPRAVILVPKVTTLKARASAAAGTDAIIARRHASHFIQQIGRASGRERGCQYV